MGTMASRHTSMIALDCWKEHTCVSCGGRHAYPFVQKISGTATDPDRALRIAQSNAAGLVARRIKLEPCPTCGLYQPDMVAQRRLAWHRVTFIVALCSLSALWVFWSEDLLPSLVPIWIEMGICGLAGLVHASGEVNILNQNPAANRQLASARVAAGTLGKTPGREGPPQRQWIHPPRTRLQVLALCLLVLPPVLAGMPEIIRSVRGWPINAPAFPPVAGPGDTVCIYMFPTFSSVKGFWRGSPNVLMHTRGAPAQHLLLTAATSDDTWASTIYAESKDQDKECRPWVRLQIPADSSLAGQAVDCDIRLDADYPAVMTGTGSFAVQHATLNRTETLHLATPGAGQTYAALSSASYAGAGALLLMCGAVLMHATRALRRRALPTALLSSAFPAEPPLPSPLPPPPLCPLK